MRMRTKLPSKFLLLGLALVLSGCLGGRSAEAVAESDAKAEAVQVDVVKPAQAFRLAATYKATLVRVIDGDTVVARIDLGFDISVVKHLRLIGIDAPERTKKTMRAGQRATVEVKRLLSRNDGVFYMILAREKPDGFGRPLARIFYADDEGEWKSLNNHLLDKGFARKYRR